jgi:hypothetical protein
MQPDVKRITLLLLAMLFCMAQSGDAPLHIKAFYCEKSGADYCGKRLRSGFEPARIRLEVYLSQHSDNRAIGYGLECDGWIVAESRGDLDGHGDPPLLFVEHREISAGHCIGVARLARRDGTVITARSEPVVILSRD